MPQKINHFMLLLMVVAVVVSSAIGTTTVYADDGTTGGDTTQPASTEVSSGDQANPPQPSNGSTSPSDGEQTSVADKAASPSDSSSGQTTSSDSGQTQPAVIVAAATEQPVPEQPVSVPQILDQAPEGTGLVVVNQAGAVEPLATQAAADIIATSDPMWCPIGQTPGGSGCTTGDLNVTNLITAISLLSVTNRTGAGTIYFTSNYSVPDATFDHTNAALSLITDLTIQGGWNGGTGGGFLLSSGGTTFSGVPLTIDNWIGNITIKDIDIAAASGANYGLSATTTGTITLNNVSVNGTTLNASGKGDGAILNATGNVDITKSEFDSNKGTGLKVKSTGTINLDTVSASSNTLTGAYLDSCRYETVSSGLCAGNGKVTITSATTNLFNGNGSDGLFVDAGGGIAVDHTQADTNAFNGAVLTSADDDGTGNVTVDRSEFNTNPNATGLDILTDGSIGLTNVDAFSNGTGTVMVSMNTTSGINVTKSNFGIDNATGNTWTGLHAESGGLIDLNNVVASYNGTNGAYLDAQGSVTVANSTFNNNVHFNYPQDPGLYAKSNGGDINLTNVTADNNTYGAGAVLNTASVGNINITGGAGYFNGNGTFGIQAQSQDGSITLDGVTASLNKVKGAYLSSYGLGDVSIINNSAFVENGSYGIYASTYKGNINLNRVAVTGNDVTDYGAVLTTNNGGSIFVQDSFFNQNTAVGLRIIASGPVNLTNVTADQNGENGVEVYSTYTASCRTPESKVVNVAVNVDGGTFTNNSQYGLMVKPGPKGTLVFTNPSTFGGNGLGEYLLDLGDPSDCPPPPPTDTNTKKPNVVQMPYVGGEPVEQACDQYSSTVLELPSGTWANVGCPYTGFSKLEGLLQENLPGALGAGENYLDGITLSLTDKDGNSILNADGTVTVNFKIREDSRSRKHSILFWDPKLNNGKGGWVQLPKFEVGTSFPLHPDDPEDGRIITSGVQQIGDTITFTVNFPGIFVLVAQ